MHSNQKAKSSDITTVGEIAATVAGAAKVLRTHGIDYCAMGDAQLDEASQACGADHDALERELVALQRVPVGVPEDSAGLVDYIVSHYHDVHRRELRELVGLARRVETVHRDHENAPVGLADLIERTQGDLEDHMRKEESVLFPSISSGYRGSLFGPIVVMRHEHDEHAKMIRAIQVLTDGYTVPADACGSWRTLYAGLDKLTTDLLEHIFIENDILFPRFENAR